MFKPDLTITCDTIAPWRQILWSPCWQKGKKRTLRCQLPHSWRPKFHRWVGHWDFRSCSHIQMFVRNLSCFIKQSTLKIFFLHGIIYRPSRRPAVCLSQRQKSYARALVAIKLFKNGILGASAWPNEPHFWAGPLFAGNICSIFNFPSVQYNKQNITWKRWWSVNPLKKKINASVSSVVLVNNKLRMLSQLVQRTWTHWKKWFIILKAPTLEDKQNCESNTPFCLFVKLNTATQS